MLLFALSLLGALTLASCKSATVGADASLARLQGHWAGTGPGGDCSVTISGNSLRFYARTDHWYETTFTIPAGTEPKQILATIVDATTPGQDHIGKVVVAIFNIEDGVLKLATSEDSSAAEDSDPWERFVDHYELKRAD